MAEQINQLENTEQTQSLKQQNIQIQTVESFLQEKISDPDTQNKIIPLFTNIKKDISESDVLQFLQNNNFNLLVRRSKSLDDKEAKDFLISNIMDYLQTIGKSISVINNTTEENDSHFNNREQINKSRQDTRDEYNKLDAKFKLTAEQTEKRKSTLQKDGTLSQIEKSFSGDQQKINDFINFSYTANTFPDAPEVAPFKQKYEELKGLTGVVENAHDLSGMKAPDTILRDNDNIKSYADNADNPNFSSISKFDYFEKINLDDKQTKKLLSFADEKIQQTLAEQKKILLESKAVDADMNPVQNIPDDMKKNLSDYNELLSSTLATIQNKLQTDSQSIMRERTTTTPIQGLARYFDTTEINGKSFSEQMKNNAGDNFSIENDILHMTGKVGDADVGFSYDLTHPDAQLQADDSMHFDPVSKTFSLGTKNGGTSDMGIRMPTLSLISDEAKTFADKNMQTLLNQSATLEDFQINFKTNLSGHLLNLYGKPNIVGKCVQKQVEKNLTAQDIMKNYFPADIQTKNITQEESPEAHELMQIFDTTLENNSLIHITSLHTIQQRFITALDNDLDGKNPKLEDSWKMILGEMKDKDLGADKTDQHRGTSSLNFFTKISPDGKLNIEDFGTFVTILEKGEGIKDNMNKFSPSFQTLYDQAQAEQLLENFPGQTQVA